LPQNGETKKCQKGEGLQLVKAEETWNAGKRKDQRFGSRGEKKKFRAENGLQARDVIGKQPTSRGEKKKGNPFTS